MHQNTLCSAKCLTSPSLAWDTLLAQAKVHLDLVTGVDMLHMFKQKQMRGGFTMLGSAGHVRSKTQLFFKQHNKTSSNKKNTCIMDLEDVI